VLYKLQVTLWTDRDPSDAGHDTLARWVEGGLAVESARLTVGMEDPTVDPECSEVVRDHFHLDETDSEG
jgi:hypothetical protein